MVDRAPAALDETWRRGIGQARQRTDVQRDHLLHLLGVGCQQRASRADAGIVDKGGDAGVGLQHVRDAGEIRLVAEIRRDDLDRATGLVGEALGQFIETGLIAGHEDQVIAPACQAIGVDRTNARGSAGDQRSALRTRGH